MTHLGGDAATNKLRGGLFVGLASALPVVVLILIVVLRLNPRFFFHDDRQSYFAGTYHYLGKSLLNGNIPFTIPWQGVAGNFVLDPQNGALNPIYWVQSLAFAQLDNLVLASTLVSTAFLLILTWGTAAWIWRLTHHAAWAAVAGSAGGLGGFALWWLATSWHPGIVSLAFLPWVGYSLAQRTPGIRATVALGVAVYCAVSTGWPFTVLAVAVLSTASLLELGLLRQWRTLAWQMVTISAGALLAAPAWIITAAALDWTARGQGIVNTFFLIPNLADVLNTAIPTATSSMNSFVSPIIGSPITYAGGFGIATLALLDWRRVDYKRTGFITITAAYATCLLLTQMPEVGPFRWAFRMIPAVALLTTVACAYLLANFGMVLTRARLVAAVLVLGVGGIVAAFRYPPWVLVQVLSILLALAFLLSLYKYLQPAARQRIRSAAIPLALVLTMSLWPFLVRPENLDIGDWGMPGRVSDYAGPLGLQSTQSLALYPSQDELPVAESARQGVFFGQSILLSPARSGVGYAPVGQRYAGEQMCLWVFGWLQCPEGLRWLGSVEPTTGRQWIDLLGVNTLVSYKPFVDKFGPALADWRETGSSADYLVLARQRPMPVVGRMTYNSGGMGRVSLISQSDKTQVYELERNPGGVAVFADVYWPGYTANFNGQSIPVVPLDNHLVSVQLPPGSGTLTVTYRPAGSNAAIAALGLGLGLLLAAAVISHVWRRRSTVA